MPAVRKHPAAKHGTAEQAAAENRRAWEDWATVDPFWAILTEPEGRHGQWDLNRFFASGYDVVESILSDAAALGRPHDRGRALDFGCGVGRLTRALAAHFPETYGVDVAPSMIDEARRLNAEVPGCTFVVNTDDDLRRFATGSIDLVCSLLVLQHVPSRRAIETYLREFVRVLAPGGIAIFQLPTHIPEAPAPAPASRRRRLALRRRVTRLLRRVGVSRRFLYGHLGWAPDMPMTAIPFDETVAIIESSGGSVLRASEPMTDRGGVESRIYSVTAKPADPIGSAGETI